MPAEEEGRTNYVRFLKIICVVQLSLGVALLICGVFAVRYTSGQTDTFGPPYFTGAFIVGVLITIAGIISVVISRKADTADTDNQEDVKDLSCFMCAELGFSVATCMGCFIGLFFVAIYGLKDCDPYEFGSFCNYTENMSQNKTLAVFILLSILASAAVSITNICCSCRYGSHFGINFRQRHRPLVIVGGASGSEGPVTTYQATTGPIISGNSYNYSPVIVGGATPNMAAYSAAGQYQSQTANPTIQELQEQNRLLQEQVRLQQQQLELQQQLQQQAGQAPPMATPMYTPPPPSYEQCTSDDTAIRQLEEHNRELQHQSQQQQQMLEKKFPPPGPGVDPSAPPE